MKIDYNKIIDLVYECFKKDGVYTEDIDDDSYKSKIAKYIQEHQSEFIEEG